MNHHRNYEQKPTKPNKSLTIEELEGELEGLSKDVVSVVGPFIQRVGYAPVVSVDVQRTGGIDRIKVKISIYV